jgi:hypothetical protein
VVLCSYNNFGNTALKVIRDAEEASSLMDNASDSLKNVETVDFLQGFSDNNKKQFLSGFI